MTGLGMRGLRVAIALALGAAALRAGDVAEGRFLDLLRAEDHAGAGALAHERVAVSPTDGRWWAYLGFACALQDRHEDAVDAFARADCRGQAAFAGKAMLYQRARSLAALRLHARARAVIVRLAERYPFSRLAGRDEALALSIERRLAEGVSRANLDWYRLQTLRAAAAGRHGLTIEHGEEFLALAALGADTRADADDPDLRLALASACHELGDSRRALAHLELIADPAGGWRAGMLRALALHACGDGDAAAQRLVAVSVHAPDPVLRERAERLYLAWQRR